MNEEQPTVTDQDNQEFSSAFDAFAEGRKPEEVSASEEASGDQGTAETEKQEEQGQSEDDGQTDDQTSEQGKEPEAEAGREASEEDEVETGKDDWEQKYKSVNGRVHAYQRQAEDSKQQLSSAQEEIADLRRQLETANTQKTDGKKQPQDNAAESAGKVDVDGLDMKEIKEYAPEAHAALVQQQSTINQLQEEINSLKQQTKTQRQAQQQKATDDHVAAIEAAHPDVSEVLNAPEFASWIDNQPNAVRRISEEGSTEDVIWMLDNFKESRTSEEASKKAEEIQNKRNQRLKDAATIPAKNQSTNRDDGLSDFGSAFKHFADKKDRGNS